ncbi:hypothetical protein Nepgr_020397 [Nepenthes gracilis]|uniref:Uncharacterized protein n=1 Tax=Nepenthes gracilis TaxID=150966 RepID=A0AAD3XWB6_NEPGR|nr:hypothetical protein Nepgr_020397 [Nepenthes gracilis]
MASTSEDAGRLVLATVLLPCLNLAGNVVRFEFLCTAGLLLAQFASRLCVCFLPGMLFRPVGLSPAGVPSGCGFVEDLVALEDAPDLMRTAGLGCPYYLLDRHI